MSFSVPTLLLISALYLAILFGIAHATDRNWLPRRWTHHPLVYILSLGVFAGAWAVFGAVSMAHNFGYGYLAYYLGLCGAFLLAPVLLHPILRLARSYQLSSLADLFTFRYRSQWAGTLVTLCSSIAIISLLSLQMQAIAGAIQILAPGASRWLSATLFAILAAVFTALFGARRSQGVARNEGLVMAMAFEALVKLVTLGTIATVLLFTVFDGTDGLNAWLQNQSHQVSALERRLSDGNWRALLLISFAAALVMPHMFHMTFTQNPSRRALARASWGLPLYLLLLALPIPIILWSARALEVPGNPELFTLSLGVVLESPLLAILAYLAGLSAASALTIVLTLALSGMLLNHLILPLRSPPENRSIYTWLQGVRRLLILAIILAALLFHGLVGRHLALENLGLLALTGVLQLLPGVLAVIYWPEGNRKGVISGIAVGMLVWFAGLVMPFTTGLTPGDWLGIELIKPSRTDSWHVPAFVSLTLNVAVFALTSMLTHTSNRESRAAESCSIGAMARPPRRELEATSSEEFKSQLTAPLGAEVATREVDRALTQLELPASENRPYPLRRLRDQLEVNLSGLLGPAIAQDIVQRHLGFKPQTDAQEPQHDIQFVEEALEDYKTRLTGLAAELDSLRRHYRQILQNLPIAACSLGSDHEILMWNHAMEALTGVEAGRIVGATMEALPEPWQEVLASFHHSEAQHQSRRRVDLGGQPHWFNLHQSDIAGPGHPEGGTVILVEDQTETRRLEEELIHSERLASVGRLAAGVAHEVGNPVTGIACLAQNLKLETQAPGVLDTADEILSQTHRISSIQQSLMNFARSGQDGVSNPHAPVRIRRCVDEAIHLISLAERESASPYRNHCDEELFVPGDEQRLVQVFVNLLSNARDAAPEGTDIPVEAQRAEGTVEVTVTDEGDGIAPGDLDHIFDPFYTTKGPDRGTGLGLSLVYSIVEEHHGIINVESPANPDSARGTRFVLRFPEARTTNETMDQPS
ncbi:ATP-binding protein [Halomonadaceae bacterium KBTZ08]